LHSIKPHGVAAAASRKNVDRSNALKLGNRDTAFRLDDTVEATAQGIHTGASQHLLPGRAFTW